MGAQDSDVLLGRTACTKIVQGICEAIIRMRSYKSDAPRSRNFGASNLGNVMGGFSHERLNLDAVNAPDP